MHKLAGGYCTVTALVTRLQARFIMEKIDGTIVMENKKKKYIVDKLVEGKYDPDPVKLWKEAERKRVRCSLID